MGTTGMRLLAASAATITLLALACARGTNANLTPAPTAVATPMAAAVKRVTAPIDGITIDRTGTAPLTYAARVKSGLPNGCISFGDYRVDRSGDRIEITVMNLAPADPDVMCTMIYGIVRKDIPLPGEFVEGTHYTVAVNDKAVRLVGGQKGTAVGDYRFVPSPIEGVDVQILESFPVQYRVAVTSGLPDSCHEFDSWQVHRDGNTVRIDLRNRVPSAPMACAQVYRTELHSIAIGNGNDYQKGASVTVQVNDRSATFVAQ